MIFFISHGAELLLRVLRNKSLAFICNEENNIG